MKFEQYEYARPDVTEMENQFNMLLSQFAEATKPEQQLHVISEINIIRADFDTMENLSHVRYTLDTTDEFYQAEKAFFDENSPIYQGWVTKYYKAIIQSSYREELERVLGKQLFDLATLSIKTFSPEVLEDLQRENKLTSEYVKLIASAKIPFEGKERNLNQLAPFMQSEDREMRRKASEASYSFFTENEQKFDDIYDQLVKIRVTIAQKLGYTNFIQLAYDRLNRTDYDETMVANFRAQVLEHIVPAATKLFERQQQRIGVDSLHYYDLNYFFSSGNATPKGDANWQLEQAKSMYSEMSKETGAFFNELTEENLLSLETKQGKASGGYCTFFSNYKMPFIFANFNGTAHDVTVLTHEAGHAFQMYASRNYEVPEYNFPTLEACEIHSMSMEFFTWPWMEHFFKEDTEKFKFYHLASSLQFIPYGVTVDEFQHFVYEHPEVTPAERKEAWHNIERKYLPHRTYEDNDYLERGGFWIKQGHIFKSPFYYIDYTLAQICAFQFWKRIGEDRDAAWNDYVTLCEAGGSKPFTELTQLANLISPFSDGCVASVIGEIEDYLDGVDDSKF